jgi:hypothetical protein
MFLHLSNDVSVYTSDIIGIFDIDKTTLSEKARAFLASEQKNNRIYYCTLDLPKSFAVTTDTTFICGVNTDTLKKRTRETSGP